jgi:hypothetical protein
MIDMLHFESHKIKQVYFHLDIMHFYREFSLLFVESVFSFSIMKISFHLLNIGPSSEVGMAWWKK